MNRHPSVSILALYPVVKGFAFVYFDKPSRPIDWGVCYIAAPHAKRNSASLYRIEEIIVRCQPDVILIEDYEESGSRRSPRIRRLYRSLGHIAQTHAIDMYQIAKADVRDCFASVGASTREETAQAVARQFPEFGHRLPRKRNIWESQAAELGVFVAGALAITFYRTRKLSDD